MNPDQLAELEQTVPPRSALRAGFAAFPEAKRKRLQQNLSDFGFYDGVIDGLWGRRTEAAVRAFVEKQQTYLGQDLDVGTRAGVAKVYETLSDFVHEGGECDGCV